MFSLCVSFTVFGKRSGKSRFKGLVRRCRLRVRAQVVAEAEMVAPFEAPLLKHMQVVRFGCTFDEIVPTRDAVFAPVTVAQCLEWPDGSERLVKVPYRNTDVQNRLGKKSRYGSAADMLNVQHGAPKCFVEPCLLLQKRFFPVGLIRREPNRVVLEAKSFRKHGI